MKSRVCVKEVLGYLTKIYPSLNKYVDYISITVNGIGVRVDDTSILLEDGSIISIIPYLTGGSPEFPFRSRIHLKTPLLDYPE